MVNKTNKIFNIDDIDMRGKIVMLRVDLNVPVQNNQVTSDARIQAIIPSVLQLLAKGAGILLVSHFSRPKEGKFDEKFSIKFLQPILEKLLKHPVKFASLWFSDTKCKPGDVVLCENVRFLTGERANAPELAKKLASICDVFVMDAFGCAHRAHASTYGIAKFANFAVAGPLMQDELSALSSAFESPEKPVLAIVGGSKVSTKLTVLQSLLDKVEILILGGGIANTFIAAQNLPVGKSLYEPDLINVAQELLTKAKQLNKIIAIAQDVMIGDKFDSNVKAVHKNCEDVGEHDLILDIGPKTIKYYQGLIKQAKTIVWNGPVGVFEWPQFAIGTKEIALAISNQTEAFSIAGGGDTLAAIDTFNIANKISYISTGGGAFLEFIQGKKLPAIEILEQRYADEVTQN